MLGRCWANVVDGGPTATQHWNLALCFSGQPIQFCQINRPSALVLSQAVFLKRYFIDSQSIFIYIKHDTLNRGWFNADPTSTTLAQHQTDNGSTYPACRGVELEPFKSLRLDWPNYRGSLPHGGIYPDPALFTCLFSRPLSTVAYRIIAGFSRANQGQTATSKAGLLMLRPGLAQRLPAMA